MALVYFLIYFQRHFGHDPVGHVHHLVFHVSVQIVCHRLFDGPSTDADRVSVCAVLRCLCSYHDILGHDNARVDVGEEEQRRGMGDNKILISIITNSSVFYPLLLVMVNLFRRPFLPSFSGILRLLFAEPFAICANLRRTTR